MRKIRGFRLEALFWENLCIRRFAVAFVVRYGSVFVHFYGELAGQVGRRDICCIACSFMVPPFISSSFS